MNAPNCPYSVGDLVRFSPSKRTIEHYQDVERFGVKIGEVYEVESINDGVYLHLKGGMGGWPWNEFEPVSDKLGK